MFKSQESIRLSVYISATIYKLLSGVQVDLQKLQIICVCLSANPYVIQIVSVLTCTTRIWRFAKVKRFYGSLTLHNKHYIL